jgi:hypothetical protein
MSVPAALVALAVKLCAPGPRITDTIHAPSFLTFSVGTVAMCLAPSKISTGREMSTISIVPLRRKTPGAVVRAAPVMASVGLSGSLHDCLLCQSPRRRESGHRLLTP